MFKKITNLFKSSKTNKVDESTKKSSEMPVKQDVPNSSIKQTKKIYYTFKVAGVTKRNDENDDIQKLISKYVKEQLEFEEVYNGLKNKDILEDYYDDKVYEISDLFLKKGEINFVFEPDNPYDPNAIKVISKFMGHIGYVPKDENVKVIEIIKNKDCDITAEIIGGKYKYVDQDEEKVKIDKDYYGIEIELSYE